jgi:hypothetical protein
MLEFDIYEIRSDLFKDNTLEIKSVSVPDMACLRIAELNSLLKLQSGREGPLGLGLDAISAGL